MWQRFTKRARNAIMFAQKNAGRLHQNYVSTEHLLLGLLNEQDNHACRLLTRLGLSLEAVHSEINQHVTPGDGRLAQELQFTPVAKHALDFAHEESRQLDSPSIGTEHLLLGLLRETEGVASRVLTELGADIERGREEIKKAEAQRNVASAQNEPRTAPTAPQSPASSDREGAPLAWNYQIWQRFTERARRVFFYSQEEAARFGAPCIMTEHLLLGMTRVDDCIAARIFVRLGLPLQDIRASIEANLTPDVGPSTPIQFAPGSRRVIDLAFHEARRLGCKYIGTEHILLALLCEDEASLAVKSAALHSEKGFTPEDATHPLDSPLAAETLKALGMNASQVREEIEHLKKVEVAHVPSPRLPAPEDAGLLEMIEKMLATMVSEIPTPSAPVVPQTPAVQINPPRVPPESPEPVTPAYRPTQSQPPASEDTGLIPGAERALTDQFIIAHRVIQRDRAGWRGKSLLSFSPVTRAQIDDLLIAARCFKEIHKSRADLRFPDYRSLQWDYPRALALLFEKPSLRTRVSFEAGMAHLGGHAIHLAPADVGLGTRETVPDVGAALSRWVDAIAARVFQHETVEELAANATIPVINALSDREHPCQAFADLLTILEHKGAFGPHLKLAYVGDGNNMLHSLLLACAKVGINISAAACPPGYMPSDEYVKAAREAARLTDAKIVITHDPKKAAQDADIIYTDVWTSMGQEDEREERRKIFAPYQVNAKLLSRAKSGAIVLHCLPAHRGEEITEEVMEAHKTVILDQAENRLHTQKALLALILGP